MDPADVLQDAAENISAIVSRPIKEIGPHTPQQMVTGRINIIVRQRDPNHVQRPISQDKRGPHSPEQLCA